MKRNKRAAAIEKMREVHVTKARKRAGIAGKMKDAFITARYGALAESKPKPRGGHPDPKVQAAAEKLGNPYITRKAKWRKRCEHKFKRISDDWKQCTLCAWCKPRRDIQDHLLQLPPILEGRELPPLSADQQRIDFRSISGVLVTKRLRARRVEHSFTNDPFILRYAIEVRLKRLGWQAAGVMTEMQWYKVLPAVQGTKNPKKLWRAVQKVLDLKWQPPWQTKLRDVPLAERLQIYHCGACSLSRQPITYCKHHEAATRRWYVQPEPL